jgi:IMP dehydrogenase
MNELEVTLRLLAGVALILTNGFFVAIEFALTRVRQYPESEFDEPGLKRGWEMTDDLEIYLTSCQVGITPASRSGSLLNPPWRRCSNRIFRQRRWRRSGPAGSSPF